MPNLTTFNRKVRGVLVRNKVVDLEQLDKLLEEAQSQKISLASLTLEKALLDDKKILSLLATDMNIAPVDLEKLQVDSELFTIIPKEMAQEHQIFPVAKIGKVLTLAIGDPSDVVKLDNLSIITGFEIRSAVATEKAIIAAIEKHYVAEGPDQTVVDEFMDSLQDGGDNIDVSAQEMGDDEELDVESITEGHPVIKLVNLIIFQGVKTKVSDIHIEPFEKYVRVRYRHDGILKEVMRPPKKMLNAMSSRIKIVCGMDIAERRRPQDGKFQIKMEGRQVDFRVSILPMVHGEKIVLRILDTSNLALSLDSLGFEDKCLSDFKNAISSPYGMVLVTGPTGSGKSTTLYSAVREVLSVEDNIVTVEDPVEYQLDGVNQVPVNVKRGLTFAAALRSILRQDPDIVMIGEIRDAETIDIAVKAALTGHLVFSTLHTNDSPSTITRMIDMGMDPFMVSASLLLASAQRLGRKLCEHCKEQADHPEKRLLELGFTKEEIESATLYKAVGCGRCANGYKGRFALLETLPVTEGVKRCVINKGSALDIKKIALEEGMVTLRKCGIANTLRGRTSVEEVTRITIGDD